MPKSLFLQKDEIRKPDILESASIPINTYQPHFYNELERYGREKLRRVYYDMLVIREFEQMLTSIKTTGEYQKISYTHLGATHLSIGQESAAVGQCLALEKDDLIFGSHRSHGEIIAKCFSAIRSLSESELYTLFSEYREGKILYIVEKYKLAQNIYDIAEYCILYGLLSEIFTRENGFNAGLGGSMHAFFVPLGSMPNNAIVGGSANIAMGAALYKKIHNKPGIVIANIGDAAISCGAVWEALMFSSMDQYYKLWDKDGAPPYLINVFNNFYGMGGQTVGETTGMGVIARIASGVNAHSMYAERVDGFNPLAVADATYRKKEVLLQGRGPVLLDTITYRFSEHSCADSDISSYRTIEEIDEFKTKDPIIEYATYLIVHNILSKELCASFHEDVIEKITKIFKIVINTDENPFVTVASIDNRMFSQHSQKTHTRENIPDISIPREENSHVQELVNKKRYAFDTQGKSHSVMQLYTLRDGIFEAVLHSAYTDANLVIYGEENRDWGGAFDCYRGLTESLPYHRLFNPPIAESAIVGTAIGYALSGGTALVELMYCDFIGRAGDEIFNQMSKWQSMSASILQMPLILRVSVGNKYGAQHSQDWTSLVAHIPGLQIMYPVTPYDAKGMLATALSGSNPVIFFESQKLYNKGEMFYSQGVPEEYYTLELGVPSQRRKGKDLSIITLGPALYPALEVADYLSIEHGIELDIIDLRFINPLQYDILVESVKKTAKVLLVSDAVERGSFMHTVASNINAMVFNYLNAAPCVVGAKNLITPPAELASDYFPNKQIILDAIHQNLISLKGYQAKTVQTISERIRLAKIGI